MRGFAPGRVNLIGEHTDYNGGHVFPCAIEMGIECSARKRNDSLLRFYSENFGGDGVIEAPLEDIKIDSRWADYPKSVIKAFECRGFSLPCGADFAFAGNLPDGAGLSSSAAIEVLTGLILRELFGFSVTPEELARLGQLAENRFIGVSCGIMDQFASAMGRKNSAIMLNTSTLRCEYSPLPPDGFSILLADSGVKHSLAASAYNDRRRECEEALRDLSREVKISALCELSPAEFEKHSRAIKNEVCRRRARHAVYENQRVLDANEALKRGELKRFGKLMNLSHISLRDDYEVSCAELDFLAETAQSFDGVYGARMTGGGFGGCTVNLVDKSRAEKLAETIKTEYKKNFGAQARVFEIKAGSGAALLPV